MRSTIKTIISLIIIGLVVVVTFLYGNAQKQAQLRHDQDLKRQVVVATPSPSALSARPVSPTPAISKTTSGQPAASPVAQASTPGQVAGNSLSSASATPQVTSLIKPLATPTLSSQPQPKTTPVTGESTQTALGTSAIILAVAVYYQTRRRLRFSLSLPRT